jgi:hypothetical protein
MKKITFVICCSMFLSAAFAQDEPKTDSKGNINISNRANDHFLIQFGVTNWTGKPDSITTKGLSRSFNMYFMFDFPFKTNPHLSLAIGPGIGTDNIFFDKMYVGIKDLTPTLPFNNVSDTNHFKKYKLVTAYVEAPIEFRYSSNPAAPNSSYKFAVGVKIGALLNAHVKGKTLQNKNNGTILDYTQKETGKHFFNSYRFLATARFGRGAFNLFGTYQLNKLFKEGVAADMRPFTIGLTISGL